MVLRAVNPQELHFGMVSKFVVFRSDVSAFYFRLFDGMCHLSWDVRSQAAECR